MGERRSVVHVRSGHRRLQEGSAQEELLHFQGPNVSRSGVLGGLQRWERLVDRETIRERDREALRQRKRDRETDHSPFSRFNLRGVCEECLQAGQCKSAIPLLLSRQEDKNGLEDSLRDEIDTSSCGHERGETTGSGRLELELIVTRRIRDLCADHISTK